MTAPGSHKPIERVLVITDNPGFAASVLEMLGRVGTEAFAASSVAQGADLCDKHRFDVAVIDMAIENGAAASFFCERLMPAGVRGVAITPTAEPHAPHSFDQHVAISAPTVELFTAIARANRS
jgi:CheY-like chemotaxis protein